MKSSTLNLTRFEVRKLQCIGGEGRAAPYRITTYCGRELGTFGEVMEFTVEASNDALIDRLHTRWLNQVIHGMRASMARSRLG